MSLLRLFCNVDDFWQVFSGPLVRGHAGPGRQAGSPLPRLSPSEIMTILIHFHQSHYRTFKAYYTEYVLARLRPEFQAWSATTGSLS